MIPGEQYNSIFDQPRDVQVTRLQEQVKDLADQQTTDEVLDFALGEIAYTIHVIRERIFFDARERNMAAAGNSRKPAATAPDTIEDII